MRKMQKGRRKTPLTAATTRPTQRTRFGWPTFYAYWCWLRWTPIHLREGCKWGDAKAYVCLFTCASTRAVHLQLTKRLSSEAFQLAFRWFMSRRGLPVTLLSHNARTFKSASKDTVKISRAKEVTHYIANNGVTWKFIVERATWWGGFWQHLIQTVKCTLNKVIGRSCLSFQELNTLLVEVEGIVKQDRWRTFMMTWMVSITC